MVHKSGDGRGAAAIAVFHAVRCDTGMPSRVIRLSTEQAALASVFWAGRVRARRPRPMMTLYHGSAQWRPEPARHRRLAPSLILGWPPLAVQAQPGPPAPHPQAEAQG